MRAQSDLYVHPELTDSEVWGKDEAARTRARLCGVVGALTVAAASTFAAVQYTSIGKSIRERFVLSSWTEPLIHLTPSYSSC